MPNRQMTIQEQQRAFDVLTRILAWETYMGGFEAPVWEDARRLADSLREAGFERSEELR